MIPGNQFTTTPDVKPYIPPYNLPYNPLEQTVLGGIALNDPSQGRMYQNWVIYYDSPYIRIKPEGGSVVFSLEMANVTAVSLAFDSNMNIAIAYQKNSGSYLYYYNFDVSAFSTLEIAGATSCRAVVDDPRTFYTPDSDIMFGYTLNGNLYYRQQRDKYLIERLIGPADGILLKMAPSEGNRLQFELG